MQNNHLSCRILEYSSCNHGLLILEALAMHAKGVVEEERDSHFVRKTHEPGVAALTGSPLQLLLCSSGICVVGNPKRKRKHYGGP
jgi:hypothetical protein